MCNIETMLVKIKTCESCGKEIIRKRTHNGMRLNRHGNPRPNDASRFCSKACSARECGKLGGAKKKEPKPKSCKIHYKICPACDALFITKNKQKKYCNINCLYKSFKDNRYKQIKIDLKVKRSTNHQPKTYRCKECKRIFKTEYANKHTVFCSEFCSNKAEKRIRRHFFRKVTKERVDWLVVFTRDHWICQLCHIKTLKSKRGTINSRAPELDHIIPLCKGGSHTYSNVHCACRDCNIKKGGEVKGQLRLC